jgi:hypothetical protein
MKFASSWRFSAALMAIAVLLAFAAWPGGGLRNAQAALSAIDASSMVGSDGNDISLTISGDVGNGTLSVTNNSDEVFDLDTCDDNGGSGGCDAEVGGDGTATLTLDTDSIDTQYDLVLLMTLNCSDPEAITVTADEASGDSDTEQITIYCVPSLNNEDVQIEKQADNNDSYTFDWDADNGDCLVIADDGTVELDNDGSFELEDNDNASFYCESAVNLTIDERDDYYFVAIDDCDHDDGVAISDSRAYIDISDLDSSAFCTWINDEDYYVTPTVTAGPVKTISITLTSATIECGQATLVQVVPRSASGGPAPAGTTLTMTSSLGGTFQPGSSITSQFPVTLANFLYTAPQDVSGTTNITARSGNVQTTVALQITCQATQPAPTATTPPLAPPSAGSGGLVSSDGGSSYLPFALAVAAAAAVLGLTAASRRFAAVRADVEDASLPSSAESSSRPGGFALLASFVMLVVALLARRWR